MKIGIIGKLAKIKNESVLTNFVEDLRNRGYETVIFPSYADVKEVDILVVLGGDGAILHATTVAAPQNIKVIGVNYGNVGFLTEFEREGLSCVAELIEAVKENSCKILKRSMLEVCVDGATYYALNEIALQRDYASGLVDNPQILQLSVRAGDGVVEIAGDGALLSTPTGSTAYSLSAGGAILTPEVPVFMLTPVCAFSMSARPMVFSDGETFTFRVGKGKALLLVDGKTVASICVGDEVVVKKAPFYALFPTKNEMNFFTKIKNKLSK